MKSNTVLSPRFSAPRVWLLPFMGPLAAVSFLLLFVGFFTAWYVHTSQQEATELVSHHVTMTNLSNSMIIRVRTLRIHLYEYVISGDDSHLYIALQACEILETSLQTLSKNERDSSLKLTLNEIRRQFQIFNDRFQEIFHNEALDSKGFEVKTVNQDVLTKQLLAQAEDYDLAQQALLKKVTEHQQTIADRVSLTLVVLVVCGAIGGLAAGIGAARGLHQSLVELSVPVHAAAGSLSAVVGPVTISSAENVDGIKASLEQVADYVAQAVARLQKAQRQSIRSEQFAAIGQLAAGLAHEIRNPLTSMRMIVQVARQQGGANCLDERDLEILDEEIKRLNEHVQTFLNYARPPKLSRCPTLVRNIIEKTVQLTSTRAKQQGVEIRLSAPQVPVTILADVNQLQQVFLNLILNAIDAQPDGGTIDIELFKKDSPQEDPVMIIRIVDHGEGIPEEFHDQIFEPFFSTKESGTGLGLPITRRIIEDHGGTITVETRSGENATSTGAIFTIELPIMEPDTVNDTELLSKLSRH